VVKLASNEGPFGPFPAALEALERAAGELNRYPDGGGWALRNALAERHTVAFEEIALGACADGVIDGVAQATLDPGDEVVTGWPSFPSYVIYARKLAAVPRLVPLRDDRIDVEALLAAIGPRTKLVCIAHPNNPTGTMNTRAELDAYFERVPEHVLTVLDQAYFEYVDEPDYPDGIEEYFKAGRRVLALRTFSKIYGLAGLRLGYGIGAAPLVTAIGKVRRPFDLNVSAQAAALASLADTDEVERRRRANAEGRGAVEAALAEHGFRVARPAVANFVFAEVGDDATPLFEALLRLGVIVRPLAGFGAPGAIRVTVGTPEESEIFARALSDARASLRA
jgi:histidinol-phosphate aminotransferase